MASFIDCKMTDIGLIKSINLKNIIFTHNNIVKVSLESMPYYINFLKISIIKIVYFLVVSRYMT